MIFTQLAEELQIEIKGEVKVSEAMSRHTTWQIGGPADLFLIPEDKVDLEKALKFANITKVPLTIIGGGSNLLVHDSGIRGLVIKLANGLKKIEIKGEEVVAEGGVRLPFLVRQLANKGLAGLEFAAGIPGTLGGAIVMNAGAHGGSMSDIIQNVVVMDSEGKVISLKKDELDFSYRSSKLKKMNLIVIEANLKLFCDDIGRIKTKLEDNLQFRKEKQPWEFPNAGSVFKNPPGQSAGRLIESLGAKGWQIGRAQISPKHANFIVNLGGATCQDVLSLISKVQEKVFKEYKIVLEPEIIILGG